MPVIRAPPWEPGSDVSARGRLGADARPPRMSWRNRLQRVAARAMFRGDTSPARDARNGRAAAAPQAPQVVAIQAVTTQRTTQHAFRPEHRHRENRKQTQTMVHVIARQGYAAERAHRF